CRLVARRELDVSQFRRGRRLPHLAAALSRWAAGADHIGTDRGGRHRRSPRRPLNLYSRLGKAEQRLGTRRPGRQTDLARGPGILAEIYSGRKKAMLPDSKRKFQRAVGGGPRLEPS